MNNTFAIGLRHSAGNLHIRLQGEFNGACAWALRKTISRHYRGTGRIFVRTDEITIIHPEGTSLFKKILRASTMALSDLYLKGINGFSIAPDGARVLICSKAPATRRGAALRTVQGGRP